MKYKRLMILFAVLSVLMIAFIWGNSLQTVEQSDKQSGSVMEVIKPKLDPKEQVNKFVFHDVLRKVAHIAEFVVLGLFVGGFAANMGQLLNRKFFSLPVLITLLVAVGDEFIQNFSGRGSAVTDVVLDFVSGLSGLAIVALFLCLKEAWMYRQKN